MLIHAMSTAYEIAEIVLDSPTFCEIWVSRISTDNSQRKFAVSNILAFAVHIQTYRGRPAEAQKVY